MKFTNKLLSVFASITRKLVYHRKLNRLYKHINKLFLILGANPNVKAKMKDGTKMLVDLSTKTERISFYTGRYDPDLIKIIHTLYNTNATFIDIGGNIGFYSVSLSNFIRENNATGKVVAFEPFEGNYKKLLQNIEINNLNKFCEVNQFGLSNKKGVNQITLREDFKHGSRTGNAAIRTSDKMDEGFKLSPIKLERLDDVWEAKFTNYPAIDFIKIDIEGHEDFCLEGAQKTIKKFRPTILMEVNKPYYDARKVELDKQFFHLFPEKYEVFKQYGTNWRKIESLNKCSKIDNVFLIPEEKLNLKAYHIFNK